MMSTMTESNDRVGRAKSVENMEDSLAFSKVFEFTPTTAQGNDVKNLDKGDKPDRPKRKQKNSRKKNNKPKKPSPSHPIELSVSPVESLLSWTRERAGRTDETASDTASTEGESQSSEECETKHKQTTTPKAIKKTRPKPSLKKQVKKREGKITEDSVGTSIYNVFDYSMSAVAHHNPIEDFASELAAMKRQAGNRDSLTARTGHRTKEARAVARKRVSLAFKQQERPTMVRRNSFGSIRDLKTEDQDLNDLEKILEIEENQESEDTKRESPGGSKSPHHYRRASRRRGSVGGNMRRPTLNTDGSESPARKSPYRNSIRARRTSGRPRPTIGTDGTKRVPRKQLSSSEHRRIGTDGAKRLPRKQLSADSAEHRRTGTDGGKRLPRKLLSAGSAKDFRTFSDRRQRRSSLGAVRDLGDDHGHEEEQQPPVEKLEPVTDSCHSRTSRRTRNPRSSVHRRQSTSDRMSTSRALVGAMAQLAQEEADKAEHKAQRAEKVKSLGHVVQIASLETTVQEGKVAARVEKLKMSIKEEIKEENITLKSELKKGFVSGLKKKLRRSKSSAV